MEIEKARKIQKYVIQQRYNEFHVDTASETFKVTQVNKNIQVLKDLNRDGKIYEEVSPSMKNEVLTGIDTYDSNLLYNFLPINPCIEDCMKKNNW
jgi:hypothetical protein